METVGVRQLKEKTSEIIRRVREDRETFAVTFRGREVAHIVPASSFVKDKETNLAHDLKVWAQMEDLAEEIGALWPEGVSAEEAIREQRREL